MVVDPRCFLFDDPRVLTRFVRLFNLSSDPDVFSSFDDFYAIVCPEAAAVVVRLLSFVYYPPTPV